MNNETRTVSRHHAELALREAVSRLGAAIYQVNRHDPETEEGDITEMVLEAAENAFSVALQCMGDLDIGIQTDESQDSQELIKCYREWLACIKHTGPALIISDNQAAAA